MFSTCIQFVKLVFDSFYILQYSYKSFRLTWDLEERPTFGFVSFCLSVPRTTANLGHFREHSENATSSAGKTRELVNLENFPEGRSVVYSSLNSLLAPCIRELHTPFCSSRYERFVSHKKVSILLFIIFSFQSWCNWVTAKNRLCCGMYI